VEIEFSLLFFSPPNAAELDNELLLKSFPCRFLERGKLFSHGTFSPSPTINLTIFNSDNNCEKTPTGAVFCINNESGKARNYFIFPVTRQT
jgi:hypothetical protein